MCCEGLPSWSQVGRALGISDKEAMVIAGRALVKVRNELVKQVTEAVPQAVGRVKPVTVSQEWFAQHAPPVPDWWEGSDEEWPDAYAAVAWAEMVEAERLRPEGGSQKAE